MGTGIVSVALATDQQGVLSRSILAIAAIVWIALGVVLCTRLLRARPGVLNDARSPGALTGVAATAVLGTGALQLGWTNVAWVLLAAAFPAWIPLTGLVLSRLGQRAEGQWFMLTVAPAGLAALAAELAGNERVGWLLAAALGFAAIGLLAYPLVLARFDWRDLACARGEHWIGGGSLAISALAFSQIALADRHLRTIRSAATPCADIAFGLWTAGMLWLVALLVAELRWPRPRYHPQRWSTVFPLGMYAACSFAVAAATGMEVPAHFARGWTWIALAGWSLAFAGLLRRRVGKRSAVR
jgi:tellurite resistance protein TehA-like permease